MMKRYLFPLVILLALVNFCGCAITSTVVSGIGLKSVHGKRSEETNGHSQSIEFIESDLYIPSGTIGHFAAIPYSSLETKDGGRDLGKIEIDQTSIKWVNSTEGKIRLKVNNQESEFLVKKIQFGKEYYLNFESRTRRWYWYPAQCLMVATVPIDISIDVIAIGGIVIAAPFVYAYQFLEEAGHRTPP
jgi:hypothetical protein